LRMAEIRLHDRDASAARGLLELAREHPFCVDAFRARVEALLVRPDVAHAAPAPSARLPVTPDRFVERARPSSGVVVPIRPGPARASDARPMASTDRGGARLALVAICSAVLGVAGVLGWRWWRSRPAEAQEAAAAVPAVPVYEPPPFTAHP